MCFSLPESNSFPGPRQLHINWPRRRCQGCSAQVLWRCHRHAAQYRTAMSASLSVLSPLILSSASSYRTGLCMSDCLLCKHTHTYTHSLRCFFLIHRCPSINLCRAPSSPSLFCMRSLFSFLSPAFSVRSISSRSFTACHSWFRPHWGQLSTTPAWEETSSPDTNSLALLYRSSSTPDMLDNILLLYFIQIPNNF